jgi:hypothetical protein
MGKSIGSVANPFSPLSMMGFYKSKQGVFPLRRIPGGTYDFYTGRINIGNQWVGERLPNRAMRLSLLHQNSGLPLQFVGGDEAKFLQPMDD